MKKYLVLENDSEIGDYLQDYIEDNKLKTMTVFMANIRDTEEIGELFMSYDCLLFQPTLISWGQYNTMLMLMYDLITKGKLSIKEVHIFAHGKDLESELRNLWDDKRKYLDIVLQHIKIYQVGMMNNKIEIKL